MIKNTKIPAGVVEIPFEFTVRSIQNSSPLLETYHGQLASKCVCVCVCKSRMFHILCSIQSVFINKLGFHYKFNGDL